MQAIVNTPRYSSLSYPTRVWFAMLLALILCFGATLANAAGKPAVVVSQASPLFDMQGGGCPNCGFTAQMTPAGGSFAVSNDGYIAVAAPYGNVLDIYNPRTGAVTAIAVSNISGATFDSQKNIYTGILYSHSLYKFPYVNGIWATTTTNAPTCTGSDTVACTMPNIGTDYNSNVDFKNTGFDAAGNLFMVTATASSGTAGGSKIYELAAANLYGSPTLVYTDDATHAISSIALDPWGNLFFTDAVYGELNNSNVTNSSLNVLPYSSSTGYASSKTIVATWTNPSPGGYDNVLSGVAVDPATGTVYYSDSNQTIAIPNNLATPPDVANAYVVSTTGAFQLMPDGNGSLYAIGNHGNNKGVFHIFLNNVFVPPVAVGSASQATNVVALLNGVDCTGSVAFALVAGNITTASATAGTCAPKSFGDTPVTGAAFPVTVSLTPAAAARALQP